jgi:hypothetical protein
MSAGELLRLYSRNVLNVQEAFTFDPDFLDKASSPADGEKVRAIFRRTGSRDIDGLYQEARAAVGL